MKVLKGFAIVILSIILFFAISALGLAVALNVTIMNPDFIIKELGKLDTTSLVKDLAMDPARAPVPPELRPVVIASLDTIIPRLEPWVKQQVNAGIYAFNDYMLGKRDTFALTIPLGEIKGTVHDVAKEAFLKTPPPQFAGAPRALLEQGFEQFWTQFSTNIPPTYTITESVLPPNAVKNIKRAREYIGWYQTIYKALIALTVVLVLGIILIARRVRSSTRALGITALLAGGLGLAAFYLANQFARPAISRLDVPAQVRAWLPQLLTDALSPVQIYAVGLVAAGVALLIVSLLYHSAGDYE